MKQKFWLTVSLVIWIVSVMLTGCTSEDYPKILALGFVNGNFELSVLDLNNGSRSYITGSNIITPTSFSYCNSGKKIAYSAPVEDGEELILWEVNNNTYALTKGNNKYRFPVWSPNCLYIAFNSSNQNRTQVYILNIQDKTIHPLVSNQDNLLEGASWSPDSRFIVTHLPIIDSSGQKTAYGLEIVKRENGTLIGKIPGAIDFPFSKPVWDINGKYFLFSAKRGTTFDLYKYDIDLKTESAIVQSEKDDRLPIISPDGKRFVFLQSEPAQNVSRVGLYDISLQSTTYLSDFQQNIASLLWLKNEEVVYSKYDVATNKTGFYLLRITDGKETKLGDWDGQYITPVLFP